MEDFNTKEIVAGELNAKFGSNVKMPEYSPINFIVEDIKRKKDITSSGFGEITTELPTRRYFGGSPLQDVKEKASLTTQVPITEAYDLVGGEWMSKFPTYKQGRDNAEFAAQTQSTADKWINGTLKLGGKILTGVVGNVAAFPYGIGKAIEQQSLSAISDNDFTRYLDDLNTKMGYTLPNYYRKQVSDMNLFEQATEDTSNFIADKIFGGASFLASAVVSEGIWASVTGGASLATAGARWGTKFLGLTKVGNAIGKYSSIIKKGLLPEKLLLGNMSKKAGIVGGKIGEGVNTLRFTITSAGYESSVETLQFRKEAEENFYANFEKLNGRAPEAEDIAEFKANLDSASNSVFATNMALVGSSNLLAFGKTFNVKLPKTGIGDFLDKKLYGLGLDDATKMITPSRLQKINRATLPYLRSMVEEGLYEEGLQSVTNKTANKWIEHTYNPSVQMENFDMAGAIYENMAEQYGTKEGWVENGVGMIIGILGEVGTKGRSADVKQKEELFKQEASFNQTYTQKALGEHMLMLGRMKSFSQEAEGHAKAGNITAEKIANDGAMHALFNNRYQIGRDLNETVSEMKSTLDTLTEEQFAKIGIEASQIDQYKEDILNEFKTATKQFLQNRKYAEYIIGKNTVRDLAKLEGNQLEGLGVEVNNELLIQALTYNLSAGESANKVMSEITSTLSNEIGADYTASLKTMMSLMGQKGATVKKVNSIRKQIPALETERDALTRELQVIQESPKEIEPDRVKGKRRGEVVTRLKEVNDQLDSLNTQLTDLTKEINNNREFTQKTEGVNEALAGTGTSLLQDSITAEDLVKLEENIKKLEGLIENYKTTNPQKAEYIENMLEEFKNANEIFQANQRTAIALSSGQLKVKHFNSWAQKKLQGKKTLDEFTSEWLTDLLSTYTKNKVSDMSKSLTQKQQVEDTIITEEEWTNFVDNGEVSEKVLNSLADKVMNKEPLSERENAIFIDKTSEIEEILKQTVQPTNPNQEKIDALLEEKRRLEEELSSTSTTQPTSTQADIEAKKADIKIGKVGNTEYEVKSDGVYFKGIKLDNTENKTHRQLIEADIKRRRQEELENSKIQIPRYFTFKELGGAKGKSGKALSSIEGDRNEEIQQDFESKLQEGDKLIEPNGDIYYFKNGKVVKSNGQPRGMADIGAFINGVTIDRTDKINAKYEPELKALEETKTSTNTQADIEAKKADIERRRQKEISDRAEVSIGGLAPTVISDPNNKFFGFAQDKIKPLVLKAVKSVSNLVEEWFNNKTINNQKSEDISTARDLIQLLNANPILKYFNNNVVEKIRKFLENKEKGIEERTLEEFLTDSIDKINAKYDAELKVLEETKTVPKSESKQQKRIDEINKELEKLNQTQQQSPTPLNKTQLLRDRLDNILKNSFNNITGIIGEDGQIAVVKPTEAEIEEYRELLSQPTEELSVENGARLEELKTKLGQWRLLDSAIQDDNVSIAELIEQLTQLEQQIEEETTSTEVTNEATVDLKLSEKELLTSQGEKYDVFEITQNVFGSATVRAKGEDTEGKPVFYEFSHLYPSTFLKDLDGEITIKYGDTEILNATLEDVNNVPTPAVITRGGLEIIKLDAKGTVQVKAKDFEAYSGAIGMFVTDTGTVKWSYKDVYYFNGVDYVKVPSDYIIEGVDIEPQEAYNIKKGDVVTLEVDVKDKFTSDLLDAYKKADKKGKKEAEDKLRGGLKIYVVTKNGTRVAILKGLADRTENTEIFDIRNRAMQALLEGKTKVGISVEVSNIFMGSPSFTFNSGKVDNLEFTKEATDLVEATGYVQNGELTLNKDFTEEVNKTFVGQISKRNKNKKTPVVVIRKGAYLIAYPISVKKSKANKGNLIENLLNQNLTKPQLAIAINNLIQENKIKTEKVIAEEITDQKIEDLIQAFNNKESFRTADEFADKAYKAENLQQDGLINIDLRHIDKAISDPKVKLDFSTIKYVDKAQELINNLSLNIEEVNEKLNNQAIDLYQDFLNNEDKIKFLQGHEKYYNFMKNNPITKDNDMNTNIDILRQILPMRTVYLNEKMRSSKVNINNIKQNLNNLDRLVKSVKAQKEILNSGEKNVDKNCAG